MAEATGLRNNALPYPVYGAPWGVVVPIFDADGDLVSGATTPDSEVSKNGDTFTDCTNEATEIASGSGMYYLLLTGAEMTADVVAVILKSATSGAKTTPVVLYPRKLVTIRSGTAAGGDTAYITLDASASGIDDWYNGMLCVATIDGNVEARIITDYTGSNQRAAVTPAWNVAPDNDDTFILYLPEGVQIPQANLTHVAGAAVSASAAQLGVNVVQISADATAADNCELMFDGTGYAGGTTKLSVDLAARTVEGSLDELEVLKVLLAALAGKSAGGGTGSITFRDQADAKNRIAATVDGSRNRTAVTLDVS